MLFIIGCRLNWLMWVFPPKMFPLNDITDCISGCVNGAYQKAGFPEREEKANSVHFGWAEVRVVMVLFRFLFIVILHLDGEEVDATTYSAILNESSKHFHVIFHLVAASLIDPNRNIFPPHSLILPPHLALFLRSINGSLYHVPCHSCFLSQHIVHS